MKIAVAGKGGAGKTTFCATTARLLARRGDRVVAIDGDTNPNLADALGADRAATPGSLPSSLVSRRLDGPPALTASVAEVLDRYGLAAPDGVTVLRMGAPEHPDEGCMCSAHATVSTVLSVIGDDRPGADRVIVLLDLEASPEHLSRGTARHADVLVLVAEPYFRSLEAVRLQARLAAESAIPRIAVVANKCRTPDDAQAIAQFCDRHALELVGVLPWSSAPLDADRASLPLIDSAPDDPVVAAISVVIERLLPANVGAEVAG